MNRDQFEGGVRHLRGRAKTAIGAVKGQAGEQFEGAVDQVTGAAQHAYGRARETAHDLRRDGEHLLGEAERRGRAIADDLGERGRHYRTEAEHRGRALARHADDNRAGTLLLVAGVAFGLGWLLRRGD